jgi:DNA repair protein RAD16
MVQHMSAKKANAGKSRDSLSSVSTSHDYDEASGYSTPETSAVATPKPESKPTSSGRGRPAASMATASSGMSLVAKAAALRNSKLSLGKRKRIADSEDDEDDNTPDAQLARALQEQEDAAGSRMHGMDLDQPTSSKSVRRTLRKAQKISPMTDYAMGDEEDEPISTTTSRKARKVPAMNKDIYDLSDDDDPISMTTSPHFAKKPKIELSSVGANDIKFTTKSTTTKQQRINWTDVNDSDGFESIGESEDDIPLTRIEYEQFSRSGRKMPGRRKPVRTPVPPPPRRSWGKKVDNSASRSKSGGKSAANTTPALERSDTKESNSSALSSLGGLAMTESEFDSDLTGLLSDLSDLDSASDDELPLAAAAQRGPRRTRTAARQRVNLLENRHDRRGKMERARLEAHHPELHTMWKELEDLPKIGDVAIEQPANINRELKPFQLQGVAWMKAMEKTAWGGGLLGDEMGMGKTIQAVSLIMSDFPASKPSLVLIPPVALMQWQQEIESYTDGTLKTFVYHGTNAKTKGISQKDLMKYNVILMSYNSLESMYRKQEKGFKRKHGIHKEESIIHQTSFHRVILDEAHNIKVSPNPITLPTNTDQSSHVLLGQPKHVSL